MSELRIPLSLLDKATVGESVSQYMTALDDLQNDAYEKSYSVYDFASVRETWRKTRACERLDVLMVQGDVSASDVVYCLTQYEDTVRGFLEWLADGNIPSRESGPNANLDDASEACCIAWCNANQALTVYEEEHQEKETNNG